MAKNPYLAVIQQIKDNAMRSKESAIQGTDTQEKQAYINYMRGNKSLATGLSQQGIAGGGSESALLGAGVGYQNTLNTIGSQRATTLAEIQKDATANQLTAEAEKTEWDQAEQVKEEERFANTVTGYDSLASVENAIDAATASGDLWKIPYLKAQRASLKEIAKQEAAAKAARAATYSTSSASGTAATTKSAASTTKSAATPYVSQITTDFNNKNEELMGTKTNTPKKPTKKKKNYNTANWGNRR